MSISKDDWNDIEEKLKTWMPYVEFKLNNDIISIKRVMKGEGKTTLAVYINDKIEGSWARSDDETERPICIVDVWCLRSASFYKAKDIKHIEKVLGKRRAKKEYPKLHDRQFWHVPYFSKASVLVRQFKKIDGLILVNKEGV
jgi:hypothetical protein